MMTPHESSLLKDVATRTLLDHIAAYVGAPIPGYHVEINKAAFDTIRYAISGQHGTATLEIKLTDGNKEH